MLMMRDHSVEDYQALRDMDATDVGILGDDDRACLNELGEYFATTDAWQRFAIWLLHKHFEPRAGEVFVERAIPERAKTETAPAERGDFTEDGLSAIGIRFAADRDADVRVIGLEFAAPGEFGSTAPLSAADEAVLASIAERLEAHGKIDRFGVKLIRNPLGITEREILLETCDSSTRTMHCDVSAREAIPADLKIVETTWRWRVVQGETRPIVMQDCTAGCTPVGEGHDLAHRHSQTDDDDNPIP
jgi:hypothetical protein